MTLRNTALITTIVLVGCSEYDVRADPPDIDPTYATPALEITPAVHDFGGMTVPCGDSVEVTLSSVGDGDLTISELDYASNGTLALQHDLQLPLVLEPGQSTTVDITFEPTEPITDFGTLTVTSDDPAGKKTAEQTAVGEADLFMEAFTEPGIPPVDVLFLIDQSCSMAALAEDNIRQGIPDFLNELQQVADWQLIQVTKQDGCANGGIVDQNTPNADQLLADNAFNAPLAGLYTEKLLQHAEKALSLTGPGQCNDGFLRQGASLHILIASDEAEQSQPFQTPYNTAVNWVTEYENYVSNPDYVKVSGILNLLSDDVCSDGNGGSPDGYLEAVNYTSGVALDICQPGWGSQLTDIATATVAGRRVYNLSRDAVAGSLTVLVNGQPATDWEFSDVNNSVTIFEPPIGEGDIVEIGYGVLAECESST